MNKILIIAFVLSIIGSCTASNCWKDAYGRGVGKPVSTCEDGHEEDAGLCYPFCRDGFYGVGPVCWQHCPNGFPDTGVDCLKPESYGRGAGYPSMHECVA